jgi:AcrR family transcriptional regulator
VVGVTDTRKARQLAEREQRIITAARALAEARGWESVTVRRLADAIEYSQPVLYSHFPQGRSQVVTAVALVGFDELATALSLAGSALSHDATGEDRVRAVITTYLGYAEQHPAVYEAMFRLPITAPFASPDTPRSLQDGFDAIVDALRGLDRPPADLGTAAEVFWASMHGVATLQRAARFAPDRHERRINELVRYVTGQQPTANTAHATQPSDAPSSSGG